MKKWNSSKVKMKKRELTKSKVEKDKNLQKKCTQNSWITNVLKSDA